MTPTEQDNELREKLLNLRITVWKQTNLNGQANLDHDSVDEILQLITADRKRVALESRLNEVQNAYEHWINGRSFISSYFRDRIALLSNTKESKDE